jgi:low temperature requirement protein LtrA
MFLLIALGETVVTTGTAIAEVPLTLMTLATGTFALTGTVALWALIFGRSHRLIIRHMEKTSDPIRTSRHAANALTVMVAGLVAVAVANEEVITHPHGHTSFALSLLLSGGPILFLAAQGWYLWAVPNVRSQLHLIGGVALLLVGLAALAVPPYAALILVGTSLTTLAIIDQRGVVMR